MSLIAPSSGYSPNRYIRSPRLLAAPRKGTGAGLMPLSRQFWSRSAAWERSRRAHLRQVAASAQELGFGLNRRFETGLTQREAAWLGHRGEHYLRGQQSLQRALRANRARQWITVDPDLQRDILAYLAGTMPDLARAFDVHLGALALTAWSEWPVDTGFSKILLALEYRVSATQATGTFESRAGYTPFIRPGAGRRVEEARAQLQVREVVQERSADGRVWEVTIYEGSKVRRVRRVLEGAPAESRPPQADPERRLTRVLPWQGLIVRPGRAAAAAIAATFLELRERA